MPEARLITGGTGFVGEDWIEGLLQTTDDRLDLLCRSEKSKYTARKRIQELGRREGQDYTDRIILVDGDLGKPFLGLEEAYTDGPMRDVTRVDHLGASTDFQETKREVTYEANVGGTKNVLDVLEKIPRLERFHYMSTAYTAGNEKGVIPETQFDRPTSFKNPYEETKWEAEQEVWKRAGSLPVNVLRPSIIIGKSEDGDAKGENRVFYGWLLAMHRAAIFHDNFKVRGRSREELFNEYWRQNGNKQVEEIDVDARIPGHPDTTKNVVSLDDVVQTFLAVDAAPFIPGTAYNMVNPQGHPMGKINDVIQSSMNLRGFKFDPELAWNPGREEARNSVEKRLFTIGQPFFPYFKETEPTWERDNVASLPLTQKQKERIIEPGQDRTGEEQRFVGRGMAPMTEPLFWFMMQHYVCNEIVNKKVA